MTAALALGLLLATPAPASAPPVPFAPGAAGAPAAEVLGFSPAHRVAWVERRAGAVAVLRIVDLADDRVLAERRWDGDPAVLRAHGIAPVSGEVLPDPVRLVIDLREYRLLVDGRDLRVRRLQTETRRLDWKKVGTLRTPAARPRGWVKSPFERRAAALVDDQGLRVVGVHLDAGYAEEARPVTARALYEEALLAREIPPEMEECRDQEEAARVAGFLAQALAADRSLRDRARRDFPRLAGTLSFELTSGEVDPSGPGELAAALERASWSFTSASCGGGLYTASVSFGGGVFAVRCPQVQQLEGEEREEAERAEEAGERRFRVEGMTLVFEDGTRWELSVDGGVATISGGPESFVESVFVCDAGV